MSTRTAVYTLLAATLLGVVSTVVKGSEPGFLLGFFVSIGGLVAALSVRRGAVHVFFPLPALILFSTGVITGAVHDTSLEGSTAGLGVGFLQWISGIFYPIIFATIVVLLAGAIRWLLDRQLVTGQFSMSAGQATGRRRPRPSAPSPRRSSDPWSDDSYRVPRTERERPARDPWGDPANPPQPLNGNRPAAPRRPVDRLPPQNLDPRDQRGPRPTRDPRDPWAQR